MNNRFDRRSMFYGAKSETFETARILRKNTTLAEKILWKKLRDRNIFKIKFRRQHPVNVFIVDFYCHELKIAIEVDGEIHYDKTRSEYDCGRTAELEKLGITLLRFTNQEVIFNMKSVISTILLKTTALGPL